MNFVVGKIADTADLVARATWRHVPPTGLRLEKPRWRRLRHQGL
jgi:hypothetical protein